MESKRGSFTSSIGFVFAAAGSAVGLGNIWRFPYIVAKDGGGLFIIVYLALMLTFGYALITSELAIGRMTKQGPLTAYRYLNKRWGFMGILACLIPAVISPYYCVIGGWVLKYFVTYVIGQASEAAMDGAFTGFIASSVSPIVYFVIFLAMTVAVVAFGVQGGIEKISKVLMPILFVMVIGIAIFSLTLSHEDADGTVRTGLQGLKFYLIPNFSTMTWSSVANTMVDALGQMFYSLSIAMGVLIAYGSYMQDKDSIVQGVNRIQFFDTGVAFFAGMMVVPAVYAFMGSEGMSAGPGLMFISMPKIFASMGSVGSVLGIVFFLMVIFAALTSSISMLEAVVTSFCDQFGWSRRRTLFISSIVFLIVGIVVCLGYNALYFEAALPNGTVGQILDIFDYASNNVLMPVLAILTCVLVGWIIGPQKVIEEVEKGGNRFPRKKIYIVMIKYIAPLFILALLLQAFGIF